jgi:hypothetical protein
MIAFWMDSRFLLHSTVKNSHAVREGRAIQGRPLAALET